MKTLLINPPSNTYRKAEEHLGLAYLKSYLVNNGYDCDVIDGYLTGGSGEDIIKEILENKEYNIVGLSPSIDSLENTKDIISTIKKLRNEITILLGGHLATFSYKELLEDGADIVVRGEGEKTLLEIVELINGGDTSLSKVKGIAYRNDTNEIITNPARDLIENLDSLPFPDRTYAKIANNQGALTQLSGSRGCYGNCSFCSINSLYRLSDGSAWRGRSADSIVKELIYLNSEYGFTTFKFVDDSFLGKGEEGKNRGIEIAQRIIDSGLKIKFRISIRADNVDKKLFELLQKAGLYSVSIGIESGHIRGLKTFNKGVSVEKNVAALKILKDLDIITLMGFIGFDPYTNLNECEENLSFLKEMDFALVDVISKPLFVHAKDPITETLMNEGRLTGRDFPNYKYEISDSKAQLLHKLLENWNIYNKDIYYEITDMLTAPRITSTEQEIILISLFKKLRSIDLEIYETLLNAIKLGKTEEELLIILSNYKDIKTRDLKNIEQDFYTLISI